MKYWHIHILAFVMLAYSTFCVAQNRNEPTQLQQPGNKLNHLLLLAVETQDQIANKNLSQQQIDNYRTSLKNLSRWISFDNDKNPVDPSVDILLKILKNSTSFKPYLNTYKVIKGINSDYVTGTASISMLLRLSEIQEVILIEPSYKSTEVLNESPTNIHANSVWVGGDESHPIPDAITGLGVNLGIIDTKPRESHMTFKNISGSSRFTYFPQTTDPIDDHGTFVASIAGGSGEFDESNQIWTKRGIAYRANLLWKMRLHTSGQASVYTNSVIDAFSCLIEESGNLPLVANLSSGFSHGPHDGNTLFEEALNNLITGNKILVCGAGNNSTRNNTDLEPQHIQFDLPNDPNSYVEITFRIYGEKPTLIEFWHDAEMSIQVLSANLLINTWSPLILPGQSDVFFPCNSNNENSITIFNSISSIYGNGNSINNSSNSKVCAILFNSTGNSFQNGLYKIRFYANGSYANQSVNGYHGDSRNIGGFVGGDHYQTIIAPASAAKTIAVGASLKNSTCYTNSNGINICGSIADYSSLGPLRPNSVNTYQKPDIVAPGGDTCQGCGLLAAGFTGDNEWISNAGTSFAAPHVTGSIALLMQNFPALNVEQVKNILFSSADSIQMTDGSWHWQGNNTLTDEDRKYWGAGKLNILEAYKSMVGFDYTPLPATIVAKFKTSFNAGVSGLPIEPVVSSWGSPNYYKQKLTNGAIFLDDGVAAACWLGEGIWQKWNELNGPAAFISLPVTNEAPDPYNNDYQTVYFYKGKIYWNGNEAIVCPFLPNFTASTTAGSLPLSVQFTDASLVQNASITNWLWDFGDGTTSTEQNPVHTYLWNGNFTVTLTIFDHEHGFSNTKSNFISTFSNQANSSLVRIEYFIDNDPGLGNATPIAFMPSPYVNLQANLDLSSVNAGLHRLYIRAKDADGKWSVLHSKPLYVSNDTTLGQNIARIEYSFDSLATAGSGTPLSITPSQDVSFTGNINLASIAPGLHRLYFRAKDMAGKWSSVHSKPIYVNQFSEPGATPAITRIEYSFDSIGTAGNGLPLSLTSAPDVTVNQNIDLSAISNGLHRLYFRAKDTTGKWSSVHSKPLYISTSLSASTPITRIEYSFDNLASPGTGIPISFTPSPDVSIQDMLNTSALSDGMHTAYFRAGDANGNWSSPQSKEINLYDFNLISPILASTLTTDTIAFSWSTITGVTKYLLLVDNNPGFGSPEISAQHINALKNFTANNFTISGNWLPQNVYYWKVLAVLGSDTIQSPVHSFTYTPIKLPAPQWVPLYRAFLPSETDHFYCSSQSHLDAAIAKNYRFEGVDGYVSLHPFQTTSPDTLRNIFRFYIPATSPTAPHTKSHYYTTSEADKDSRILQGWIYEGITGYAYNRPKEKLVKLYHTWLSQAGERNDNFYTVSEVEKNNSIQKFGYTDMGHLCYVSATGDNTEFAMNQDGTVVGDGINPFNGNLSNLATDSYTVIEGKVGLNFSHLYNSNAVRLFANTTPLGNGWSHSYNASLITTDSTLIVVWPGEVNFYDLATKEALSPGVYDKLQQPNAEEFTIRKKDQTVFRFSKILTSPLQNTYFLSSITDRHNNQISLHYNNNGRLDYAKTPGNKFITFTYYPDSDTLHQGLIHYVKDSLALNRIVEYQYDNNRNLILYKDVQGKTTQYAYDTTHPYDHFLTSVTYPDGTLTRNSYNSETKRLTGQNSISSSPETKIQLANIAPNTVRTTDEAGKSIDMQFNQNGNITQLMTANGNASMLYEDANNPTKPTKIIDGMGYETTITYDVNGNPLSITKPLGVVHTFQYNASNDLLAYTNPLGKQTIYNYTNGNLTSVTTPRGTTSMTYYPNGNLQSITDALGQTTQFDYDAMNNLQHKIDALGNTTSFAYDEAGRVEATTNANGHTTSNSYYPNDLLESTTNPLGFTTHYFYNEQGKLTKVVDAKSHATQSFYDNNTGLLSHVTDQLGHTSYNQYYPNGMAQSITNRNNQSINYTYDSTNRLIGQQSASLNATFEYSNNDLLHQITDGNGVMGFTYDSLNRLSTYTDFYANQVQYQYDKANNLTKITYPGNKAVEYTYYDDNALHTAKDWLNNITTYTYLSNGSLSRINLPNGTYTTYAYDVAGRLTGMSSKRSDNTIICAYTYELDSLGNHRSEQIQEPLAIPALQETETAYSYDVANRIQTAGATSFTHDFNGNLTSSSNPSGNYTYSFDEQSRLVQVSGKLTATYTYDVQGNRRAATRNGITKRYVLDISGEMANVLIESNASNTAEYYYVYGSGSLLYRIKAADNTIQYYHYDSRGSTIAISNQSQFVTHTYKYDEFGSVLASQEADFNPFRYVGKYGVMYDDSLLYYMRARYYRPDIGRFLSEDPVWDVNLYGYANNNSICKIDPKGENAVNDQRIINDLSYLGGKIIGSEIAKKYYGAYLPDKTIPLVSLGMSGYNSIVSISNDSSLENIAFSILDFSVASFSTALNITVPYSGTLLTVAYTLHKEEIQSFMKHNALVDKSGELLYVLFYKE